MQRKGNDYKTMSVEKKVQKNDLQLYNVIAIKAEKNQKVNFNKIEEIGTKLRKSGIYRTAPVVIHKDCIKKQL